MIKTYMSIFPKETYPILILIIPVHLERNGNCEKVL